MRKKALKMDENDNVATLTSDVNVGNVVDVISKKGDLETDVTAKNAIPICHKISLIHIGKGEDIIKYASVIGVASKSIKKGEHVHIHNVKSLKVR